MPGHGYGSVLSDTRLNDLVAFVLAGAIEDAPFIDNGNADFLGDPVQGEAYYTNGIQPSCVTCHGPDGTDINFGTPDDPEYLGTIATENPWELLHKVRFGQPAAPMPSWLGNGGTSSGAADIGRYAQLNFPTECTDDAHCDDQVGCTTDSCDETGRCLHLPQSALCADDGLFCTGDEFCDPLQGCVSIGNPCTNPGLCDELGASCGCETPNVVAKGPRYVAITPQPAGSSDVPMALAVRVGCQSTARYLGAPTGLYNVAFLVDDPADAAYLTPSQWGGTVYLTGLTIVPAHEYVVSADCGIPSQPVATAEASGTTSVWGDVTGRFSAAFDGVASAVDIAAVVDGVRAVSNHLPLYTLDLFGCVPNQRLDAIDVAGSVDAVRGLSFHGGALCPDPCD
jgi:mono/diheme cytochrome c family protein